MKTLEEIITIVTDEIEKYPQRKEYTNMMPFDVLTLEGIHEQVEKAPDDKAFPVFWLETIPAGEGALCDGFSINRQYFNNKKDMTPVESK